MTYGTVMNIYAQEGKPDKVLELLEELERKYAEEPQVRVILDKNQIQFEIKCF